MRTYNGVCGVEYLLPDWVDVDALACMMHEIEAGVLDGLDRAKDTLDALGDVPVDEYGRIQERFTMTALDGRTLGFGVGVRVEYIWEAIEAEYPVSVGRMMYGGDE